MNTLLDDNQLSNYSQLSKAEVHLSFKSFKITILTLVLAFSATFNTYSQTTPAGASYISIIKQAGSFALSESGKSAPLYSETKDYPGVIRALKDLQNDINSVTNIKPELLISTVPKSKNIVIVGTLGKNKLIDKLVKSKKLNVSSIAGKWEAFLIQTVNHPMRGVDHALIIAGSDKRGTIYGIYDLSSNIGVSPWYWWADVPVKKSSSLYVLTGLHTLGSPAVKYRGFFINDEAPALAGWAREKFGGLNHEFYEKVFELLLRLKANYLWPAMWDNNFDDDDTLNQKTADKYGIVMGTSHHEPMMRSWKEWGKYGHGDWNYQTNPDTLKDYWRNGIKRMNNYESIITLGMRGNGDEAMSESSNIGLLEKIISDQRQIIGEVTGKDIATLPQVWALYKEVQEYYDKGMNVPDDVTLLMCDDNWGDLRKLPKLDAKPRAGGYGIYYHFDYVGGPRNYKWLNTNQIERTWEQMHLAYEYNAKQLWIVNVGDIKPMEFPISFFMDYAWNPNNITADSLPAYSKHWAEQQFGTKYASVISEILNKYTKYNARRKPELLSPDTYSLTNYNEAQKVVNDYNKLARDAELINKALPAEFKDAYYQLVLYPVLACSNLNDLYVTAAKNQLYAKQGRIATDSLAARVKELFQVDAKLSKFYNTGIANGKWDHMMDQTHIGYTYWQQPDSNNMPAVKVISNQDSAEMGVAVEGSADWLPKGNAALNLPQFDPYNSASHYVDIFNKGRDSFDYTVKSENKCIKINSPSGKINKQKRIWVTIDWDNAPIGKHIIPITITGLNNKCMVNAVIFNPSIPKRDSVIGFVESDGYVSIEAEHYTKAVNTSSVSWKIIPNLGRTLSAVTALPVTSPVQVPWSSSPCLEYKIYFFNQGEFNINVYLSPTLKFENKELHYAISFDDEKPQIINMSSNPNPPNLDRDGVWSRWVADNINIQVSKHTIAAPGEHTLKFWMVDPGAVLQKIVVDEGGVKPSYLGPPESFYRNTANKK